MSAHLDAPAYRPAPVLPVPVDATAELRKALDQERKNHAFTLAALRAVIDRIDLFFPMPAEHVTPGTPLALARSALEQFEGVS